MPTYKDIRTLARSLIGQVTQNGESWKAFLDSAAYTYNYAFPNQLLIYSQRPNATAVARHRCGQYRLLEQQGPALGQPGQPRYRPAGQPFQPGKTPLCV